MTPARALLAASALVALVPRAGAFSFEPPYAFSPLNPCRPALVGAARAGDTAFRRIDRADPQPGGHVRVWAARPGGVEDADPVGLFRLLPRQVVSVPDIPEGVRPEVYSMMMATARYAPREIPLAPADIGARLQAAGWLLERLRDDSERLPGEAATEATLWLPDHPLPGICGVVGIGIDK